MKYLKRNYIIDTIYMKVAESDNVFHKGLALSFNKDETKLKGIFPDKWLDYKSAGYLLSEITVKEFNEKYNKAISLLKQIKNEHSR